MWRGFSESPTYGFRPEDLHITHVYFLATPPEYADKYAIRDAIIEYEMDPVELHNDIEDNVIDFDEGGDYNTRILHDGNDHVRIFKDLRAKCAKVTVRCRPGFVMDLETYEGDIPPFNDFSRKRTLENEFHSGSAKRQDLKQIARARLGHGAEQSVLSRKYKEIVAKGKATPEGTRFVDRHYHVLGQHPRRRPPFGLQLPRAVHHRDESPPSEGSRWHT